MDEPPKPSRLLSLSNLGWLVIVGGGLAFFGYMFWGLISGPSSEPVTFQSNEAAVRIGGQASREVKLVTLLGKDAIRAIDSPSFVSGFEALDQMRPDETVLGLVIDGDVRAYPTTILSRHEIVNDVVGGKPLAITW
jgi:hypothetical protein